MPVRQRARLERELGVARRWVVLLALLLLLLLRRGGGGGEGGSVSSVVVLAALVLASIVICLAGAVPVSAVMVSVFVAFVSLRRP